jgi:hypothetical protein
VIYIFFFLCNFSLIFFNLYLFNLCHIFYFFICVLEKEEERKGE